MFFVESKLHFFDRTRRHLSWFSVFRIRLEAILYLVVAQLLETRFITLRACDLLPRCVKKPTFRRFRFMLLLTGT